MINVGQTFAFLICPSTIIVFQRHYFDTMFFLCRNIHGWQYWTTERCTLALFTRRLCHISDPLYHLRRILLANNHARCIRISIRLLEQRLWPGATKTTRAKSANPLLDNWGHHIHFTLDGILLFQRQNIRWRRRWNSSTRSTTSLLVVTVVDRFEANILRYISVCKAPRVVRNLQANHRIVRRGWREKCIQGKIDGFSIDMQYLNELTWMFYRCWDCCRQHRRVK